MSGIGDQLFEEIKALALTPKLPNKACRNELAGRCRELAEQSSGAERNEWLEMADLIERMQW